MARCGDPNELTGNGPEETRAPQAARMQEGMAMQSINRRSLLRAGLVGSAGALLPSPWSREAFADAVNLRVYWWGSQDRARRTLAVGDLYRQRVQDLGITGEPTGEDY